MKKLTIVLLSFTFIVAACSKGGGTNGGVDTIPTPPPLATVEVGDIAFKIEIDTKEVDYAGIYGALSGSQAINVNVTSTPFAKDGVTIDLSVKKDSDNSVVSGSSVSSTTAGTNALTISNLTAGVLCTATVTVTAKTLDTKTCNCYKTFSKTFKIARK